MYIEWEKYCYTALKTQNQFYHAPGDELKIAPNCLKGKSCCAVDGLKLAQNNSVLESFPRFTRY